jgi:pimeloyl-ACP methyl ester carboxylesterase
MTPLFFGSNARRLFGLYTPPRTRVARARAYVICHPWGQEYLRAHRSVRQLGNMLAGAGHHVLRFDYYGTGDSDGDMVDADLAGWEKDIETAMDEVMDSAGTTRVCLVGLRLGGTLSARVAARRPKKVEALALWDPVVSGREYLDEVVMDEKRHLRKCGTYQARSGPGGGHEVRGFPLTARLANDIAGIELVPMVPTLPERMYVVVSRALESHASLRDALAARANGAQAFEQIDSPAAWLNHQNLGAGAIPVKLLERLVRLVA